MTRPAKAPTPPATGKLLRAAALWWVAMFFLASLNGFVRDAALTPLIGAGASLPLSGATLAAVLGVVAWAFVARRAPMSVAQAWGVGVMWLVLTIAAEYALFAGLAGRPAAEITASFSREAFLEGNMIVPVLAFLTLAPRLFTAIRARRAASGGARPHENVPGN